ncbi:hypothetical protein BVG19_g2775 [[Candida] boidinii]|nr:hypothetical protein BVG19_g2775 [[Candida] boidinii]OWB49187.1 hypothetical protein B5S27_g727 [[Candida] boidinii]
MPSGGTKQLVKALESTFSQSGPLDSLPDSLIQTFEEYKLKHKTQESINSKRLTDAIYSIFKTNIVEDLTKQPAFIKMLSLILPYVTETSEFMMWIYKYVKVAVNSAGISSELSSTAQNLIQSLLSVIFEDDSNSAINAFSTSIDIKSIDKDVDEQLKTTRYTHTVKILSFLIDSYVNNDLILDGTDTSTTNTAITENFDDNGTSDTKLSLTLSQQASATQSSSTTTPFPSLSKTSTNSSLLSSTEHKATETSQELEERKRVIRLNLRELILNFASKEPLIFCKQMNGKIVNPAYRVKLLTLLSWFVHLQNPKLVEILKTSLFENLIKCCLLDTSNESVMFSSSIIMMLLPHICGLISNYLPDLFAIYSRLACWHNTSSTMLSVLEESEANENLYIKRVNSQEDSNNNNSNTDNNSNNPEANNVRPFIPLKIHSSNQTNIIEPQTEAFASYLYHLYPINFTRFIKSSKKFLESHYLLNDKTSNQVLLSSIYPLSKCYDEDILLSTSNELLGTYLFHPNFISYNNEVEELEDLRRFTKIGSFEDIAIYCSSFNSTTKSFTNPHDIANIGNLNRNGVSPIGRLNKIQRNQNDPNSLAASLNFNSDISNSDKQETTRSSQSSLTRPNSSNVSHLPIDRRRSQYTNSDLTVSTNNNPTPAYNSSDSNNTFKNSIFTNPNFNSQNTKIRSTPQELAMNGVAPNEPLSSSSEVVSAHSGNATTANLPNRMDFHSAQANTLDGLLITHQQLFHKDNSNPLSPRTVTSIPTASVKATTAETNNNGTLGSYPAFPILNNNTNTPNILQSDVYRKFSIPNITTALTTNATASTTPLVGESHSNNDNNTNINTTTTNNDNKNISSTNMNISSANNFRHSINSINSINYNAGTETKRSSISNAVSGTGVDFYIRELLILINELNFALYVKNISIKKYKIMKDKCGSLKRQLANQNELVEQKTILIKEIKRLRSELLTREESYDSANKNIVSNSFGSFNVPLDANEKLVEKSFKLQAENTNLKNKLNHLDSLKETLLNEISKLKKTIEPHLVEKTRLYQLEEVLTKENNKLEAEIGRLINSKHLNNSKIKHENETDMKEVEKENYFVTTSANYRYSELEKQLSEVTKFYKEENNRLKTQLENKEASLKENSNETFYALKKLYEEKISSLEQVVANLQEEISKREETIVQLGTTQPINISSNSKQLAREDYPQVFKY